MEVNKLGNCGTLIYCTMHFIGRSNWCVRVKRYIDIDIVMDRVKE